MQRAALVHVEARPCVRIPERSLHVRATLVSGASSCRAEEEPPRADALPSPDPPTSACDGSQGSVGVGVGSDVEAAREEQISSCELEGQGGSDVVAAREDQISSCELEGQGGSDVEAAMEEQLSSCELEGQGGSDVVAAREDQLSSCAREGQGGSDVVAAREEQLSSCEREGQGGSDVVPTTEEQLSSCEREDQRLDAISRDPAVIEEARRWPAHRAAYDDDVAVLQSLTRGWGPADWEVRDCCGNTVLHVAALRGSHACVRFALEQGCPCTVTNSEGWTPMEEVLDLHDRGTARVLWSLTHRSEQEAMRAEQQRAQTLATLRQMPDFTMQIRWRFGSPIFGMLLRAHAPSDTYTVWKCGDQLRIDGTLLGVDESNTKLMPKWKRGLFSVLMSPRHDDLTSQVCLINHTNKVYMWPLKKGPQPVCVRVTLNVNKEAYVGCSMHTEMAPIDDASRFDHFCRAQTLRKTIIERVHPTFKAVTNWAGRTTVEKVDGVESELWEATSQIRSKLVVKTNRYQLRSFEAYVHDKLIATNLESSSMVQVPRTMSELVRYGGEPNSEGSTLKARLWLARRFPLNLEHLLLLLRAIAVASTRVQKLVTALEQWNEGSTFITKVQLPLLMTLYMQMQCSNYRSLNSSTLDAELFDQPSRGHQSTSMPTPSEVDPWDAYKEVNSLEAFFSGNSPGSARWGEI